MTSFTENSSLDDILTYSKTVLPSDLEQVCKPVLIQYISYLLSEVKAGEKALNKVSSTFQESLEKLTKDTIALAVNPSVSEVQEPDEHPSPMPIIVKPFKDTPVNNFLASEQLNAVNDLIQTIEFSALADQREVCYYGEYRYKYAGGYHEARKIPELIQNVIKEVNTKYAGSDKVNSCLVTKYINGSSYCPLHSDDERSICPTSDIFTLSLGETRNIDYTNIANSECKESLVLTNNSLLISSRKSQNYWKHEIAIDDSTGIRYSLTFRCIKPFYLNSTVIYGDSNTHFLEFGEGEGKFGKWIPGERIKTQRLDDIPAVHEIPPYQNIVINVGINDINRHDRPSTPEFLSKLEGKCKDIHSVYPKTKILLSPLLPTKLDYLNKEIWDVNEGMIRLSKKHHNLIIMDNSIFADEHAFLRQDYGRFNNPNDMIHLGKLGIRALATSIKSYILRKNPIIARSLNYRSAYNNDNEYDY